MCAPFLKQAHGRPTSEFCLHFESVEHTTCDKKSRMYYTPILYVRLPSFSDHISVEMLKSMFVTMGRPIWFLFRVANIQMNNSGYLLDAHLIFGKNKSFNIILYIDERINAFLSEPECSVQSDLLLSFNDEITISLYALLFQSNYISEL